MEAPVEAALAGTESVDLSEMGRGARGRGRVGADRRRRERESTGRFVSGVDHWRTRPEFRAFAAESPLPAIVGALLRATKVNLYEDSVLVKEPGALERTVWHQDLSYFHVDGEQLCTTWCPLDPVGAGDRRGALRPRLAPLGRGLPAEPVREHDADPGNRGRAGTRTSTRSRRPRSSRSRPSPVTWSCTTRARCTRPAGTGRRRPGGGRSRCATAATTPGCSSAPAHR